MNIEDIDLAPGLEGSIIKHLWVGIIFVGLINARFMWRRSIQPEIDMKPELGPGYRSLFRGLLVFLNAPWALMGLGIVTGRVPGFHKYFNLQSDNPNVTLWWLAMGGLLLLGTYWIFKGGAERLAQYPGLVFASHSSARRMKTSWLFGCAWAGLYVLSSFYEPPFFLLDEGGAGAAGGPWIYIAFFGATWLGISIVLGQMSGWAELAGSYRRRLPYGGAKISTSGRMGATNYQSILHWGVDEAALHLNVLWPFRLGHPPLSIPWSVIEVSVREGTFSEYICFHIDNVTLVLRKRDIHRLANKQTLPAALSHLR